MTSEKSKALTPYQFFQILQEEWIVADLRFRIYPLSEDKRFWNKVKEGKRKTIEDMASRNHLISTIFTDDEMKNIFEQRIYKEKGIPRFIYKNEEHRQKQEPLDWTYYYSPGAEVRFEVFDDQKIGTVKSYLYGHPTATVSYQENEETKTFTLPIGEVTRIL